MSAVRPVRACVAALLLSALVFALGAARVDAAAGPRASASVLGGRDATAADVPSLAIAVISTRPLSSTSCTGTVVAPRVVLTAGHCVEDEESRLIAAPGSARVATGVFDLDKLSRDDVVRVERVLAFPGYAPAKARGDAGLLILARPTAAPPIALAEESTDAGLYGPGTKVRVAGWGVDSTGDTPTRPRIGDEVVQDPDRCLAVTRAENALFDPGRQLCALDSSRHRVAPCYGDSGGPAIAARADGTPVEIGIVSFGPDRCTTDSPSVFTRVDRVAPWVESWIAAVETGGPEPAVHLPRPRPPRLFSIEAANILLSRLEDVLGGVAAEPSKTVCHKLRFDRQGCTVGWSHAGTDYHGTGTVAYAIEHRKLVDVVNFTIHAVDERCLRDSGHPGRCPVKTTRG